MSAVKNARGPLAGLDRTRLRLALGVFFLALALPAGVLIYQAYGQLKWESFHQYRTLAEELARRIDARIHGLITQEEARSFADYGFLVVAGDPAANYLQPSPLAAFPVASEIPGIVGFFQIDAGGIFTTPLVPEVDGLAADYGISPPELSDRRALQDRIREVLGRNQLIQRRVDRIPETALVEDVASVELKRSEPGSEGGRRKAQASGDEESYPAVGQSATKYKGGGQAGFDLLEERYKRLGRQELSLSLEVGPEGAVDLRLQNMPYDSEAQIVNRLSTVPARVRSMRKERSVLPEPRAPPFAEERETNLGSAGPLRISIFESELDPFRLSLLDSGHFVLYRKVWRNGERSIQGALIEQGPFLRDAVEAAFRETRLSRMSDLTVAFRGGVLAAFGVQAERAYPPGATELKGDLLYRAHLSAPASDLELVFSISRLPAGPGAKVLGWTAAALVLVLCGGFLLMDRLGRKQLDLARQQQDFVSAVSHELKTPLTSIRMYSEMLEEGWADEERKRTYYAFIREESERLTRLINNVLQLARLTRNELRVDPKPLMVAELLESIRPKVATLADQADFELALDYEDCSSAVVRVDEDFFTQILINLVDNAVKFARDSQRKEVRITLSMPEKGQVQVSVRDFGPGVSRDQMKKIFKLFYRPGNELTRETVGTGIGLALVRELTLAMGGAVDLVDAEPGAEFRLAFPVVRPKDRKPMKDVLN